MAGENDVTVAVWNGAMLRLSQPLLSGPDDYSETAKRVRAGWAIIRPAVLRAYPWNCAMRRALLPRNAVSPEWGFANAYDLRPDCVRVWQVLGQEKAAWSVENGQILTDLPAPLKIRYIASIEAHQMDPALSALMSLELAFWLARPLTSDDDLASEIATELEKTRVRSRSGDAMEGNERPVYDAGGDADWVAARR